MRLAQKIILVHKGAIGDFLQTWPSILALTRELGNREFFWAGREAYTLWTSPLGIRDAPRLRREVDRLYGARCLPSVLEDCHVIWFGLRTPPTDSEMPEFWFVSMLDEEGDTPPRQVCKNGLRAKGLNPDHDWRQAWLDCFAPRGVPHHRERVLIFPGGGHPAKCWPVENYLRIAEWLRELGYSVVFVLGPAEVERGVRVPGFDTVCPADLGELQECIMASGFILGNDSGPLHLAGFCQVPGLALFGPSPAKQWGPAHIATISGSASCRPCTRMGVIHCRDPVCLSDLTPERVWTALKPQLPGSERTRNRSDKAQKADSSG
jgi:ADP-heptose:LPS heptosyltransferase